MELILSIVVQVLYILIPLLILFIAIAVMAKKIKLLKSAWGYICISSIAFWIWMLPVGIVAGIIGISTDKVPLLQEIFHRILGIIYMLEMFFVPYLIVKLVRSPAETTSEDEKTNRIQTAKKHYIHGVFAMIMFSVVCILPVAVCCVYVLLGIVVSTTMLFALPLMVVFVVPMVLLGAIIVAWLSWVAVAGYAATLTFSISAVVRYLKIDKSYPKKHLLYVAGMIIPILNIVCFVRIRKKLKAIEEEGHNGYNTEESGTEGL